MIKETEGLKLLAKECGIPIEDIINATITSDQFIELTNVAARLIEEGKISIDNLNQ